ncbi:MAG: NfeD family protein [Thermoplasmataceae archaeon]
MRNLKSIGLLIILTGMIFTSFSGISSGQTQHVLIINLNEAIDPGSATMIKDAMNSITPQNTKAVVINMNTPGGLLECMLQIVSAINATQKEGVPVYTYISSDSIGASAGSYIAMATTSIWMGPGSEIGPSTPIVVGGSALQENHTEAAMEALMTGLAQAFNRNYTAAANMVYFDQAYNDQQAYNIHLINGLAPNLSTFLSDNNLSNYPTTSVNENAYEQFLSFMSNSIVDGLFITFGSLAILVDIYHRTLIMTATGIILIGLGLFGAQLIGSSVIGIVFLLLGSAMMFLEIKTQHGIALLGGLIIDLAGTILITAPYISANSSAYPSTAIGTTDYIIIGAVLFLGLVLAYYLHKLGSSLKRKPDTGWESIVSSFGVTDTVLNPNGWVSIDGQKWKAISEKGKEIKQGTQIVVIGISGLVLTVKEKEEEDIN